MSASEGSSRKGLPFRSGPTLNPEYNDLLVKWAEAGESCNPECEECEADLTGEDVFEFDGVMWVCKQCLENLDDNYDPPPSPPREDFHSDG